MNDMAVFLCSQSLLVAQLFNGASADAGRGRLTKPEGHWRVLLCGGSTYLVTSLSTCLVTSLSTYLVTSLRVSVY